MASVEALSEEGHALYYTKLKSLWPRTDELLLIYVQGYVPSFKIPLPWLSQSNANAWQTVSRMMHALVNEKGHLQTRDGQAIELDAIPLPGEFDFVPDHCGIAFTWARGPDGRYKAKPHREGEPFDDTASLSESQISNLQARAPADLRDLLLVRDGACPVTGKGFRLCNAAHLAPKRRIDIYQTVLGEDYNDSPYESSIAILLNHTLHKAYDRFDCSFLPVADNFIFHVFKPSEDVHEYHGKVITPAAFRVQVGNLRFDLPDSRLMNWHYDQCCRMHIRGFSAGMRPL